MTLLEDLKKLERVADEALEEIIVHNHGDGQGPAGSYYNGRREAFAEAARRLEADSDFKLHERIVALRARTAKRQGNVQRAGGELENILGSVYISFLNELDRALKGNP